MNACVYVAFIVAALGHLWLFFRDPHLVPLKIVSSLALVIMIAMLATSFSTWLGWPAGEPQQGIKFAVLAVKIEEPSPDKAGHIYVWLSAPTAQRSLNPFVHPDQADTPRAFEIPFTTDNERAMQGAAQALRGGKGVSAIFGQGVPGEGDPDDDGNEIDGKPGHRSGGRQKLNGHDGNAPEIIVEEPSTISPKS